mmetsp:Transcript_18340/g.22761  ORF Transcript_18340/g.22761 Transcript_18340/m.22761 type:complete len:602 (+) Transcript_18340:247-2052(+)|eukprot:CAMPEP_0172478970 /NCGR_PEP_ID=MMETSP1066-20121228/3191_1 /TAXON_ID=671091 /ORGANISM="Coscinodiscus wailesii, Strain CCMP2513" /LENGTH=601 /DNA_ID=CAMNT_0013238961 /DNA_START=162 /DNA_END=1967 /DNA_ORIENTATION=+
MTLGLVSGDPVFVDMSSLDVDSSRAEQATVGNEVETAVPNQNQQIENEGTRKVRIKPCQGRRKCFFIMLPIVFIIVAACLYMFKNSKLSKDQKKNMANTDSSGSGGLDIEMTTVSPMGEFYTSEPTFSPTDSPTGKETLNPTPSPTADRTSSPTPMPTLSSTPMPTSSPTPFPTGSPTSSTAPTALVSGSPTEMPSSRPTEEFIEFYAMADYPYAVREVRKLPKHLEDIPADAPFIFHVGGTNNPADTNCTEGTFINTRDLLVTAKSPVFLTPGENDWNACPYPDQALSYWRQYFERLEETWNHTISVKRQPNRPENMAFFMDFVLFVGVNIVGEPILDSDEWKNRLIDDFDWVLKAMGEHEEEMSSVVIFGHAAPDMSNSHFFGSLVEAANYYKVPVLYVHGQGYTFETKLSIDNSPYVSSLQLDRGGKGPPLKIRVTNKPGIPFQYDRRVSRDGILETLSDDYLTISEAKHGLTLEQVKQGYTVDHVKAGVSFEDFLNGVAITASPTAAPTAAPQVAAMLTNAPTAATAQIIATVTDAPTVAPQVTVAVTGTPTAAPQVTAEATAAATTSPTPKQEDDIVVKPASYNATVHSPLTQGVP